MFTTLAAFSNGFGFHKKGFHFGMKHPSFLFLALLPFIVTLLVYGLGFYFFSSHAQEWLQHLWQIDASESSKIVGWLHWTYLHIVSFLLYTLSLVITFYTFVVISNIVASPFYDHISGKYERFLSQGNGGTEPSGPRTNVFRVIWEETKKAFFAIAIPLTLLLIPILGPMLSFLVASILIAWDFVDYSLSRKTPLFKTRLTTVWRHKFFLLGFGMPLLIPFLGILMLPFAILGATILFHEVMKETVL